MNFIRRRISKKKKRNLKRNLILNKKRSFLFNLYMYPPIKPFKSFFLETKDNLHSIYVEECGNKNGIPIIYLHGGPGGSIDPKNRRYFNPKKYRINLIDQRGSGKSKPKGSIAKNTTKDLINDMEKIRKILKIKKWIIVGGSWGSTLALIYAIKTVYYKHLLAHEH